MGVSHSRPSRGARADRGPHTERSEVLRINLLPADEINRTFSPIGKRALNAQRLEVYREAAAVLNPDRPGGIVTPDEGETMREVKMRFHRAAREAGRNIRFARRPNEDGGLFFRLQTPEETARLRQRGRDMAKARRRQDVPVAGYSRIVTG